MTRELKVSGRQVARFDRRYRADVDQLTVFRSPEGWTVLRVSRLERHDEDGELRSAEAWVSATELADIAALREFLEACDGWLELLDAGHEVDRELYAAWVPHQIDRELNRASIYNTDLAKATSYLGGRPVPAPGRELPGWEAEACTAMAAHLDELGWLVRGQVRAAPGLGTEPGDNVVVGVLEAWLYGWAAAVVVRVDYCGEIYARRAYDDDDDVEGGWRVSCG